MDNDIDDRIQRQVGKALMKNHATALDEREEWKYKINSIILTSSATIFSIVISVSVAFSHTNHNHLLDLSILLNGLSLLSSLFLLFGQLQLQQNTVNQTRDRLGKLQEYTRVLENNGYIPPLRVQLPLPSFSRWIERLSYVLYVLMIASYVCYMLFR